MKHAEWAPRNMVMFLALLGSNFCSVLRPQNRLGTNNLGSIEYVRSRVKMPSSGRFVNNGGVPHNFLTNLVRRGL